MTTACDGFIALERLGAAYAYASPELRADRNLIRHVDAALARWVLGDRRAAVEAWTRVALTLRGKGRPEGLGLDASALLDACLRLEIVGDGTPTQRHRGFYSNGGMGLPLRVRIRALFDAHELAGFECDARSVSVEFVDLLNPWRGRDDPRGVHLPIRFDKRGHLTPIEASIQVGPTGFWDAHVELRRAERTIDTVVVENGHDSAERRRGSYLRSSVRDERAAAARRVAPEGSAPVPEELERSIRAAHRRAFESRVALVTTSGSLERSAEFLCERSARPPDVPHDPCDWFSTLPRTLWLESEALRWGVSTGGPLTRAARNGPVWRTFALGPERDIAAWIRLPKTGAVEPFPLVIALHPEGFDEGWWLTHEERGALFARAGERAFIAVAVENALLAADSRALVALVAAIRVEHALGPVHLIGAGAGAQLAARLAADAPELIASHASLPRGLSGAPVSAVGHAAQIDDALRALGR